MKKILSMFLCFAILFSMFGCKIEFPQTDVYNTQEDQLLTTSTSASEEYYSSNSVSDISMTSSEQSSMNQQAENEHTYVTTTTTKSREITTNVTTTTKSEETVRESFCTISIDCKTILNNIDKLDSSKVSVVPSNGVILSSKSVKINEGDTVFDVLKYVTKKYGIHMEFSVTPGMNSKYIEGIGNIYEFDCGELSGWMYVVNGTIPGVATSSYKVKDGDIIKIRYSCDMGSDIK